MTSHKYRAIEALLPGETSRPIPATATAGATPCELFYADPTPAGAVRLAIADARADRNGTPDFFLYLNRAVDQLDQHEVVLAENRALRNGLQSVIGKMIEQGGEDHPWIPGADAKPMLSVLRALLASTTGGTGK